MVVKNATSTTIIAAVEVANAICSSASNADEMP